MARDDADGGVRLSRKPPETESPLPPDCGPVMDEDSHGITPPLEQENPHSDPSPAQGVVPGTERPLSILQENDPQDHAGLPERAPYETAPPGDTLGLDHIGVALADLTYPIDRDELMAIAGRWRIPTTGTHFHVLADYLVGVGNKTFRSADDVVRAIWKAQPRVRQ